MTLKCFFFLKWSYRGVFLALVCLLQDNFKKYPPTSKKSNGQSSTTKVVTTFPACHAFPFAKKEHGLRDEHKKCQNQLNLRSYPPSLYLDRRGKRKKTPDRRLKSVRPSSLLHSGYRFRKIHSHQIKMQRSIFPSFRRNLMPSRNNSYVLIFQFSLYVSFCRHIHKLV